MEGNKTIARPQTAASTEIEQLIIDSIYEIKGDQITKLDLTGLEEASCDSFIICNGRSHTQVKSIADNIQLRLKREHGIYPNHVEGEREATWILIDYFDIVVHVFYPEVREFYGLEQLWADATSTEYASI